MAWGGDGNRSAGRAWRWRAITALVLVLALVITGYLTRQGGGRLDEISRQMESWLRPAQVIFSYSLIWVQNGVDAVAHWRQVVQENQRLRRTVEQMSLQIAQLQQAAGENQSLRSLLSLRAQVPWQTVAATVIGRSPRHWNREVIIDQGAEAGLRTDMPVISGRGVVGRITAVGDGYSRVQLLTDPGTAIGGLIERTGDLVLVEGSSSGDRLRVRSLTPTPRFREKDTIVTSGLGGIYPKGLPIGTIEKVEPNQYGLASVADVIPAADFGRLEYLLVLTHPILPPVSLP